MEGLDIIIEKCVEDSWGKYDHDGNGYLDKEGTKNFVMDTFSDIGDIDGFNNDDFDQCFSEFDKDNSGTIKKAEMVQFFKKVAGIGADMC